MGAAQPNNGLAIAALILGILTFVCLGPLAGIAAVICGFLGLKKAGEIGSGRGMSIAGIILGIVGTLIFVIVIIALIAAGDSVSNAVDDALGTADSSDYDITTKTCDVDNSGFVTFSGTIENTGDRELSFTINGEIRALDGDDLLETLNRHGPGHAGRLDRELGDDCVPRRSRERVLRGLGRQQPLQLTHRTSTAPGPSGSGAVASSRYSCVASAPNQRLTASAWSRSFWSA